MDDGGWNYWYREPEGLLFMAAGIRITILYTAAFVLEKRSLFPFE